MKGPYLRLKFDFRRRWECPECHARARSNGGVTSVRCACSDRVGREVHMNLVYDGEPGLRWGRQAAVAAVAESASEALAAQASNEASED